MAGGYALTLRFDPFPTLQTQRLELLECTANDAPQLQKLRNDDVAMRYLDRPRARTEEQALEMITRKADMIASEDALGWKICLKGDPTLIGTLGFYRLKKENLRAEVGYMLLPQYWRKGLMTEALTAALHFAFTQMGFHTIEADINPANEASRQILKKLGFEKEAYFRQNFYFEGRFLDSEIYGLINPYH